MLFYTVTILIAVRHCKNQYKQESWELTINTEHNSKWNTLGGIFMAGFFVAGKINYGVKYGGLAEKPPHFTLPSK